MNLRIASFLSLVLCLTSCGDSSPQVAANESAVAASAECRIETEPYLVVGMMDGPGAYQFQTIRSLLGLQDNGFVVADWGAREVRIFDESGVHVSSTGATGGGPGEFRSLSTLYRLRGDTLVAWDTHQKRLTRLSFRGDLIDTETLTGLTGMVPHMDGILEDGTIVARPGLDPPAFMDAFQEGVNRDSVRHLMRVAGSSEWRDAGTFIGNEVLATRRGTHIQTTAILFGRYHAASTGRQHWYTGDTDRFEITVRNATGNPVGTISRSVEVRPVTTADIEVARQERARIEARRRSAGGAAMGMLPQSTYDEEFPSRETMPEFDRVLEDEAGLVWVRHFHFPAESPQLWSVFRRDGTLVAELETPPGLRIHDIRIDRVLGVWRDENDVEYVHIHRLVRRGGSS